MVTDAGFRGPCFRDVEALGWDWIGRIREAIASTERTLRNHRIALDPEAKADAVAAVYDLLSCERTPATAERVKQLIDAIGRAPGDEPFAEGSERDPRR